MQEKPADAFKSEPKDVWPTHCELLLRCNLVVLRQAPFVLHGDGAHVLQCELLCIAVAVGHQPKVDRIHIHLCI